MLIGSLIGDALGGPVEFAESPRVASILPDARHWKDERRLDAKARKELTESLRLHSYEKLRPETAPYGPWVAHAPAGTLTDDSRHKIVYLRALRSLLSRGGNRVQQKDVARELIKFQPHTDHPSHAARAASHTADLCLATATATITQALRSLALLALISAAL